jgi:predicted nucleic acid-binding protein
VILVDTSVLIDFLQGARSRGAESFERILEMGIPFGINEFIYLETLQGCRSEKDYKKLKDYLDTQVFYGFKRGRESYAAAAKMYLDLRRKGVTIGGSIDCLIALTAMENDLYLLHGDSDFDRIGEYYPLKIWKTG